MMEQTREDLQGAQGRARAPPVDLAALEQLLVRFSQLVVEQRWIKEIDINPLLASTSRSSRSTRGWCCTGRRCREKTCRARPSGPTRPSTCGRHAARRHEVLIRPIRPEDEPHDRRVSQHAVGAERLPALLLPHVARPAHRARAADAICFIDYDREMVLVVLPENEGMRRICTKLGFSFKKIQDTNVIFAEIKL
jgi:acetyltransferase